jgi:plasmid segregation protein ParM
MATKSQSPEPQTPEPQAGPGSTSPMPLLSIDLGRTSTKACVSRDPDQVVLIPANVQHLSVEEVRRGAFESQSSDPLLDMWLEYQGGGYAVGQLAADFKAGLGIGQSKVTDALIKVFAAAGYFKLRGEFPLVLGIPYLSQEQFDREKNQITSLLEGHHQLSYRGDPMDFVVSKVWVMPEGYGSLLWAEGNESDKDFKSLSVAVVDIGHQTTDFLMVDRFRFARGVSSSQEFAMSQFYDQVAAQIEGADSQSLSLIEAVHRPKGKRFFRPQGALKPTDLDDILPPLRRSFARELTNRLITWLPERATDVLITGGGGDFFWQDLAEFLEEASLSCHRSVPSRKANVLGQYVYGEVQIMSSQS